MILHLAMFTWRDDVTPEAIGSLTEALTEMAAGIPVLRSYVCGDNLHVRPGGADYAVAAIVDNEADLETYLDSPLHKAVYDKHLGGMIAERSAAQLPLDAGTLS
ncbi:Dabb family protein [Parafrigoribacterium soli]|uniref:Dabb family protein n=1 Tax=Parafrigoribacterium soli TaxID=3144663 RepID=UPI0032EBBA1A